MELVVQNIENKIYNIRDLQVMLDSDLAQLYGTETKYINRAINRNPNRFPAEFAFQLTVDEWDALRFQFGTSSLKHGGRRYMPYVFTEQGIAMLSAVLNTDIAVKVSIQIMQAFVAMRKTLGQLHGVIQRLEGLEVKQIKTDQKLDQVYKALESKVIPSQGIFYEGQLFDAFVFVSDLIKSANSSIELVDNYVDETTLLLLGKRKAGVQCTIHTRINPTLNADLAKYNQQYPAINTKENRESHDRFLILDNTQLYHFGASIKDLGKKCFAFSRMDELVTDITTKLLKNGNN